jgi:hypothetical protein
MEIKTFCSLPTRKSEVGLSESNKRLLVYHLNRLKNYELTSILDYFNSLEAKTSSKYVISNLVCKYLYLNGVITLEEKQEVVKNYKTLYDIQTTFVSLDTLIKSVKSVSSYKSRDISVVMETALNIRKVSSYLNLDVNNYMPSFSIDLDLYKEAVSGYMRSRSCDRYELYVDKNGLPLKEDQVWYLYKKISKEVGWNISPSSLRKQSVVTLSKKKGLLFTSKLLKHKRLDSTLYLLGAENV